MTEVDDVFAVHWKPLARMRTHEQVIAEIEGRLLTGALTSGDRLPPERQFAEALGVSRGAVREALRILEAIGVVEAGTGSGPSSGSTIVQDGVAGMAFVLRLHLQLASFSAADLVEVRLLIERSTARKAAEFATEAQRAELLSLVDQMRGADTIAAFEDLAVAFHVQVVRAADNALATVLTAALRRSQPAAGDPSERPMHEMADDYAAVVHALVGGDGDRAADLLAATAGGGRPLDGSGALRRAG